MLYLIVGAGHDQDVQFFSGVCAINKFIPW
ncbi:PhoP/PhoQ regulator MgrB [Enterobacter asburiae]